jgi:hypothetical protein
MVVGLVSMGDDTSLEDVVDATVYLVVRDQAPKPGMVNPQTHAFGLATRAAPTCRVGLLTELWVAWHHRAA